MYIGKENQLLINTQIVHLLNYPLENTACVIYYRSVFQTAKGQPTVMSIFEPFVPSLPFLCVLCQRKCIIIISSPNSVHTIREEREKESVRVCHSSLLTFSLIFISLSLHSITQALAHTYTTQASKQSSQKKKSLCLFGPFFGSIFVVYPFCAAALVAIFYLCFRIEKKRTNFWKIENFCN